MQREPLSSNVEIKNEQSALLSAIVRTNDFQTNWRWAAVDIRQPSGVTWIDQEGLTDSVIANMSGMYKSDYYISITQLIAQYDGPVSEREVLELISSFGEDASPTYIPVVPALAESIRAQCYTAEKWNDCEVIVEYAHIRYLTKLTTPSAFDTGETDALLNTVLALTDSRLHEAFGDNP